METTKPKTRYPEGYTPDPANLAASRYGTLEMERIWGAERTFAYSLRVQAQANLTLSAMHPDVVPVEHARELAEKATIRYVSPARIRAIEQEKGTTSWRSTLRWKST